jgi:hypothetical protein
MLQFFVQTDWSLNLFSQELLIKQTSCQNIVFANEHIMYTWMIGRAARWFCEIKSPEI